jgi:hypothetical protein
MDSPIDLLLATSTCGRCRWGRQLEELGDALENMLAEEIEDEE